MNLHALDMQVAIAFVGVLLFTVATVWLTLKFDITKKLQPVRTWMESHKLMTVTGTLSVLFLSMCLQYLGYIQ
ncbi:hypothetical protein P4493_04495 [Bacillus thuringiensis]|jgi:hypothetical protein|nr:MULTISPECIES: hypothetical protein [Bacillus]MEC2534448.1 hypothetical protein [Bacillus cereus]MED1153749.1 hypothetical protein [Bacillus paranthracis]AFQ30063.1 hypothetical protein BTF1_29812 [Bacillus thuringiensis HD-789]AJG74183.1 putative membrane protein [Bacillus thuringiensis]AJH02750.1 putative membrane protein [Bacillus thuringiensis HD1002]